MCWFPTVPATKSEYERIQDKGSGSRERDHRGGDYTPNPKHFVIERETSTLNQVGQSGATAARVALARAGTVVANATRIVEVIIPPNPKHL